MPLGGQHICAALVQLRARLLSTQQEDSLPISCRVVRAIVYSSDTPLAVCRAVAGHHQSTQHDVRESTIADTCGFIMDLQKEKMESCGTPLLNDEEIYKVLETFGLIRGSEKALTGDVSHMTLKRANEIAKNQA